MKTKLHVTLIALTVGLFAVPIKSQAQFGSQLAVQNSPAYETAANRLRSAPPRQYDFSKAVLGDIMRLMAADAGISFFGLPEGATGADRIVTFTINASPFVALETLAKANGISLIYENNIWYLRPADDRELVGRIYQINYNSQEMVRKNDQGGGSIGGSSSGGSSGSGSGAGIGLDLQGSPDFFVTEDSRLLEDIRGILDLQTNGVSATFAPTASVDNVNSFSLAALQGQPDVVVRTPNGRNANGQGGGDASAEPSAQAKVIWNSDSNSLYIVATRQQHQWVEGYLAAADQPQSMIAVEVKFLEINKDPRRDLGIDWTGVLSSNQSGGYGAQLFNNEDNGANIIDTALNLDRLGDYVLPSAILSYDDLQLRLNALFQDQRNRTVSYPRMVTLDNREVSFRSVVNQPVLSSTASASLGAGATQTSAVEYVPIGTVINILPKKMANDKLLLNVSVTVSDIVGSETINGNPFPIATSRVYTAPITVDSGYTVAISGLDKASQEETKNGVPVLGRIPLLGYAFKKRGKSNSKQHLMMLITPLILGQGDPGIGKTPVTVDPWNLPPPEETYENRFSRGSKHGGTDGQLPARTNNDLIPATDLIQDYGTDEFVHAKPVASPINAVPDAMLAESTVNGPSAEKAEQRKGLRIFGKEEDAKPAPALTLTSRNADVTEITTGAADSPANNGPTVKLNIPGSSSEPDPFAPAPTKSVAAAPKKAPAEAYGDPIPATGDSAAVQKILTGANSVSQTLAKVPAGDSRLSPDDGQNVRNAYNESKRLLGEIEKIRKTKDVPLQGELSDAWWKLVAAKSKAVKVSQRSPQSLAINIGEEEEN